MSDSAVKNKSEILIKFFDFLSTEKNKILLSDFDSIEKLLIKNQQFSEISKDLIEHIDNLTYFTIIALDIKISGIDETLINKIV